jgi:Xaa-Pro dipeptidase
MSKKTGVNTDMFVVQVLGGARTANPHGYSGDYIFQNGDAVAIDYGVYYDRYWSDYAGPSLLGNQTLSKRNLPCGIGSSDHCD